MADSHRDPLFDDDHGYPDGIRADFHAAVMRGRSDDFDPDGLACRSSGMRYDRPVRPIIRAEIRTLLVTQTRTTTGNRSGSLQEASESPTAVVGTPKTAERLL